MKAYWSSKRRTRLSVLAGTPLVYQRSNQQRSTDLFIIPGRFQRLEARSLCALPRQAHAKARQEGNFVSLLSGQISKSVHFRTRKRNSIAFALTQWTAKRACIGWTSANSWSRLKHWRYGKATCTGFVLSDANSRPHLKFFPQQGETGDRKRNSGDKGHRKTFSERHASPA